LEQQRNAIEAEIGEKLEWDASKQDKTIAIRRDADLGKRDMWHEYLGWMVDMTRRFKKAFSPRIKLLDFSGSIQGVKSDAEDEDVDS
jgi:hypothetical protein